MKTLALFFVILSSLLALCSAAEEARLTREQVKEIAALVSKDLKPGEPQFDSKKGTWTCLAGVAAPDSQLLIEIRDKDAYYRTSENDGLVKDYKMATSVKRRIAKILKTKGAHASQGNGG